MHIFLFPCFAARSAVCSTRRPCSFGSCVSDTTRGGFLLHDSGSQSVRRSPVQGMQPGKISNMRSCVAAAAEFYESEINSCTKLSLGERCSMPFCEEHNKSIDRATQLLSTRSTRTGGQARKIGFLPVFGRSFRERRRSTGSCSTSTML